MVTPRNKHFHTKFRSISEYLKKLDIRIHHVSRKETIDYGWTKLLGQSMFQNFRAKIGVISRSICVKQTKFNLSHSPKVTILTQTYQRKTFLSSIKICYSTMIKLKEYEDDNRSSITETVMISLKSLSNYIGSSRSLSHGGTNATVKKKTTFCF